MRWAAGWLSGLGLPAFFALAVVAPLYMLPARVRALSRDDPVKVRQRTIRQLADRLSERAAGQGPHGLGWCVQRGRGRSIVFVRRRGEGRPPPPSSSRRRRRAMSGFRRTTAGRSPAGSASTGPSPRAPLPFPCCSLRLCMPGPCTPTSVHGDFPLAWTPRCWRCATTSWSVAAAKPRALPPTLSCCAPLARPQAPVAEEWIFRGCILPPLLCAGFSPAAAALTAPLFFGAGAAWSLARGRVAPAR